MSRPTWIVEPDAWESAPIIADLAEIRHYNPQRFEMEQLTAVVWEDPVGHVCVGYKDLTVDEFWVRGLALRVPVMPPLFMCETAAQLASYYALKHRLYPGQGGFVGLHGVRFRGMARPGDRLFALAKLLRIHGKVLTCRFQCAVRKRLVCDGILIGGVFSWARTQRSDLTRAANGGLDARGGQGDRRGLSGPERPRADAGIGPTVGRMK